MITFSLLKRYLEIFINIPVSFHKFFYIFLVLSSFTLSIILNHFGIERYFFINRAFLVSEIVLLFLLLVVIWFRKGFSNLEKLENLLFFFPVFICNYMQASVFVGVAVLFSVLCQFKNKNLGEISFKIMILLCLYFLSLTKITPDILLGFTVLYLAISMILSIYEKSFYYFNMMISLLVFYSLHFLDVEFRYGIGSFLFGLLLTRNIFYEEFNQKISMLMVSPLFSYISLKIKTFFKAKEENLILSHKSKPKKFLNNIIIEEKIYYFNTIRSSHASSFIVASFILALSLYLIRETI